MSEGEGGRPRDDRLAAGFIELTIKGHVNQRLWLKASAVEFISEEDIGHRGNRTRVGCIEGDGGEGFWLVSETPEEVLAKLAEIERDLWLGGEVIRGERVSDD